MSTNVTVSIWTRISSHPVMVVIGLIAMLGGLAGIPQSLVWLYENPLATVAVACGIGLVALYAFIAIDCWDDFAADEDALRNADASNLLTRDPTMERIAPQSSTLELPTLSLLTTGVMQDEMLVPSFCGPPNECYRNAFEAIASGDVETPYRTMLMHVAVEIQQWVDRQHFMFTEAYPGSKRDQGLRTRFYELAYKRAKAGKLVDLSIKNQLVQKIEMHLYSHA